MKLFSRISVVLAAYTFSGFGIALSLLLVAESFSSTFDWWIGCVVLGAWFCHMGMSLGWIVNIPLGVKWPALGILLAVLSFLLWPYKDWQNDSEFFDEVNLSASAMAELMWLQLISVAPCILLGCWLARFHSAGKTYLQPNPGA